MISKAMRPKAFNSFYSRLSYSFGNEDWRVERKALQIQPLDRIFCVTASGDRPLNLLVNECQEIVSVDLNPSQNYLLSLKMHAMDAFEDHEYIAFLGGSQDNVRLKKLHALRLKLDSPSLQFWEKNEQMVAKGILYQGALEKLCQNRIAIAAKLLRGKKVRQLFCLTNLEEQRQFVAKEWDTSLWRLTFKLFLDTPIMRYVLSDPGLFQFLGSSIKPSTYLPERIKHSLNTILAQSNPFMSLIFRGYIDPENYPPYLTPLGIKTIKPRLNKLSWHTDNAIDFLERSPPNSFDCFSMSDIASYMPYDKFDRMLRAIKKSARPKARFSIRQFMSDHPIPSDLKNSFKRDPDLEKTLENEEYCFVYRFMVGTID